MNFIVYVFRYLLVIGQVAYEENYWDQVKFNEARLQMLEGIRDETKNDRGFGVANI